MLRTIPGILRVTTRSNSKRKLDLEMDRIVWIDMEMTGLDVERDQILEVACLVTDENLNVLAEGPDIIIHQDRDVLDNMNEWCKKQHQKTGLTEASKNSTIQLEKAEEELLKFMKKYVTEKMSPLAGNSIYMDRLIDVSTIKELCRRWNHPVYKMAPKKDLNHRALSDIKESVKELKYYQELFFRVDNGKK